jgi:hypothetical protein
MGGVSGEENGRECRELRELHRSHEVSANVFPSMQ